MAQPVVLPAAAEMPQTNPAPAPVREADPPEAQRLLGRVATPPGLEATADEFTFWVPEGTPVETTQLVRATATFPDVGDVQFYGVVEAVSRRSRRHDVLEERDRYDGAPETSIAVDSVGVTYARARVLTTQPVLLTPPREESPVRLATDHDASTAYGVEEMVEPLEIGLLKNGASRDAGPAVIDLADLLGQNGAHLNVTGMPGAATKSSALLDVLYQVTLRAQTRPGRQTSPLHVVPVVLNVKGNDLLFLDQPGRTYDRLKAGESAVWKSIHVPSPGPFQRATFFVPQSADTVVAEDRGRVAEPFSWGLHDLIEGGLFPYIFNDDDREDDNFAGLVALVERLLAAEVVENGRVQLRIRREKKLKERVDTLRELAHWLGEQLETGLTGLRGQHHGTVSRLYRRLMRVVLSGSGVLRVDEPRGAPLDVTATETVPPRVVDIAAIADPGLQRFVVGALVRQMADARTGPGAVRGLRYVVMLDELNRWAPRNSHDPITRLIERVAAEMRSAGVILLGAQQQASQVSEKVIEAAAVKMLGRTGSLEMERAVWSGLSPAFRRLVGGLRKEEKVVLTPSARQPMIVRLPCPPWAMNQEDVAFAPPANGRLPRTRVEE